MSLFSKMVLPLALLGAAAVLGGCVGDASLEGDDGQETQPDAVEAADLESANAIDPDAAEAVGTAEQALHTVWKCYGPNNDPNGGWGRPIVGYVDIWWGHNTWDAQWACNEWIGMCERQCVTSDSPVRKY
ncbi:hypothetical protein WME79_23395 [Sorangium sp. So ce726]|uniref:hypothetical protein n=1 Tax=Sorangium sp. So ce726 TaxID=3133319 RepID=UPI003F63DFB0